MCGRFTLRQPAEIANRFQASLDFDDGLTARFNVAPTQSTPIVIAEPSGRQARLARWGLIPSWAKDAAIGNRMINARAETLAEKPSFRAALRARRCLVPADGFFEWQASPAGLPSRRRTAKVPYFIHRRDDALFAFAGLYEHWRDPAGQEVLSYTVITTTANAVVAPLHDRMPVILLPEDEALWLADDGAGPEVWQSLLRPAPDDLLEAFPVSALVNSPAHDQPEVLVPAH